MPLKTFGVILLAAGVAVLATAGGAWAQGGRGSGGVVITSSPPGVVVELSGPQVLSGVTPWRLNRGFEGTYDVRATKPGYSEWRGSTSLSATRRDSLFILMSRRTPLSTGLRSALIPGWGQFHAGENVKGAAFLLAELGAVSGIIYADAKRSDAEDDYLAKKRIYNSADQVDEIAEAHEAMLAAFDEYDRWQEVRKRWIYAAGAVWLVNVLDATLFVPSEGGGTFSGLPDAGGSGLFAAVDADKTVLGVSVSF